MARASALTIIFFLLACASGGAADEKPLFDGATLEGWEGNTAHWRVLDGAITGEIPAGQSLGRNEFIFWKNEVHDFHLALEFRISGGPSANSGIQFRSQKSANGDCAGYQADLDNGAVWLGRIYDEHGRAMIVERGTRVSIAPDGRRWVDAFAPADSFKTLVKPEGEWNRYEILAFASHVEVRVNGVLLSVFDDHQRSEVAKLSAEYSGRLAFQLHSGPGPAKVQFRNILLAELGKTDLPEGVKRAMTDEPAAENAVPAIKAKGADGKVLNLDFETGTLQDWTAEGDGWNGQPIKGDTVKARRGDMRSEHAGEFWIGGYEKAGDNGVGTLTSTPFEVRHGWASFLIGGGANKSTRLEIVEADGGKVFAQFSGTDKENMRREVVDVSALKGRKIFLRVVDEYRSGWGHINFDDFVFHEKAPKPVAAQKAATPGGRQNESAVLWHLQPNTVAATAVGNEAARKLVSDTRVMHGFQAELIAAEPSLTQPIAFAIDERGRMWIAEGLSYPNRRPEGKGLDRIVILADENGDGEYESRKVFIEGLNLISGLEVGFGGVWVGAAPYLYFIADRNGDDAPDGAPEVLLDGWGYQDTHETLNSFSWGPDGWLYGNQGVFTRSQVGKPGTPANERVDFRAGVWRYHPVRKAFELFAHGGSNQWGIDFNDRGHLFMTHCRSFHGGGGTTYVVRNGHYWNQANANYMPFISNRAQASGVPELKNFLPASAKYDSGEGGAGKPGTTAVYGGHSHVGTMVYLGDNWPGIYRNHVFTHNLHGHQLNHQHNVREGAGYETLHAGYDLLYTPDSTYVAVDLQTGPDGAVYSIDWSDRQHCHTPQDEKWDRSNGRLYRVSWKASYKPVKVNLGAQSDAELVTLLWHRNEWHARTAQRLLQARAAEGRLDANVAPELRAQFGKAADEPRALRALWAMHVTGTLDEATLNAAHTHAFEAVRAWAVHLSTETGPLAPALVENLASKAKSDASSMVRLAVASALPLVSAEKRWEIGAALAAHAEDAEDRWLPKVIWSGIAPQAGDDPARALALAAATPMKTLSASIQWYLARVPAGRDALAAKVADEKVEDAALRTLRLLAAGQTDAGVSGAMPAVWAKVEERFAGSGNAALRAVYEQLSIGFGDKKTYSRMLAVLADEKATTPERKRAFELVRKTPDAAALNVFLKLLAMQEFRSDVIPLLSRSDAPETAAALLQQYSGMNPADRSAALLTLTSRPALALPLLSALKEKKFERKELNSLHIRNMKNLRDDAVTKVLEEVWGTVAESSGDAKEKIEKLNKKFGEAPLWAFSADAGKKIFTQSCAACHAINGNGGKLGPDLAGSWRNGAGYFIENIIDPNAVVGEDFQLHVINRNDGSVVSGLLESESDTAVTMRTATETVVIKKDEIKKRRKTPQSLMPEGLLDTLSEREVFELLKFLTTKN